MFWIKPVGLMPVGAENGVTSCDLRIFMDQATEPITAQNPDVGIRSGRNLWRSEMRFGVPCGQLGSNVVLVGESAEDLFPADPVLGKADRGCRKPMPPGDIHESRLRRGRAAGCGSGLGRWRRLVQGEAARPG
jgi:hypothetical protein